VIAHRRGEVLHFDVTDHPTAEWIAQLEVELESFLVHGQLRDVLTAED
jgi:hypothetical protein